ncbi:MAG: DUF937 domain-containing protein [Saprospiraceae bacterium]|jgi:hypothetical protein|nr:DUF937 domain-containing protein [Saprospiraceae bacterium]
MDITDLLQGPMKDIIINQVGQQLGLGNSQQTNSAVDGVLATIMNAVAKNASSPEGAGGLMAALDRDHDGSILNDLGGFLSGAVQPQNPKTANGAGILKHLLGEKQDTAAESISKASGIDTGKILSMMATLAPVVLGFLGKAKQSMPQQPQQQQTGGGLLDFIQGATKTVNQQPSTQSIFSKLLDKDGDGSMIDDIAEMGVKSIFGKILGGK